MSGLPQAVEEAVKRGIARWWDEHYNIEAGIVAELSKLNLSVSPPEVKGLVVTKEVIEAFLGQPGVVRAFDALYKDDNRSALTPYIQAALLKAAEQLVERTPPDGSSDYFDAYLLGGLVNRDAARRWLGLEGPRE